MLRKAFYKLKKDDVKIQWAGASGDKVNGSMEMLVRNAECIPRRAQSPVNYHGSITVNYHGSVTS